MTNKNCLYRECYLKIVLVTNKRKNKDFKKPSNEISPLPQVSQVFELLPLSLFLSNGKNLHLGELMGSSLSSLRERAKAS